MYKEGIYKYRDSQDLEAQILQLVYEGEQESMVIVLPHKIGGLNRVLLKLAAGYNIMSELEKMVPTKVHVFIPKFKVETEINLKDILPEHGISAILDHTNSSLSKILDNTQPLFVSKAVQKAFIEAKEEGTEAAAASGTGVTVKHSLLPAPFFCADRPFFYLICGADHTILFIGVFCKKA